MTKGAKNETGYQLGPGSPLPIFQGYREQPSERPDPRNAERAGKFIFQLRQAGVKLLDQKASTMSRKLKAAPRGKKWVYVPYFTHWKTGKRVYPRNAKVFRFLVKK